MNKTIKGLIFICLTMTLIFLFTVSVSAVLEDFDTYTEVDGTGAVAIDEYNITVSG